MGRVGEGATEGGGPTVCVPAPPHAAPHVSGEQTHPLIMLSTATLLVVNSPSGPSGRAVRPDGAGPRDAIPQGGRRRGAPGDPAESVVKVYPGRRSWHVPTPRPIPTCGSTTVVVNRRCQPSSSTVVVSCGTTVDSCRSGRLAHGSAVALRLSPAHCAAGHSSLVCLVWMSAHESHAGRRGVTAQCARRPAPALAPVCAAAQWGGGGGVAGCVSSGSVGLVTARYASPRKADSRDVFPT